MRLILVLCLLIINVNASAESKWIDNLNIFGDFRYRHENRQVGSSRHRVRNNIRARVNLGINLSDDLDAEMRFTSGSGTSPRGTNQWLGDGATDGFQKKPFNLSRAFFKWKAFDNASFYAGKMAQPFYKVGKNDLMWDHDVSPEGVAFMYKQALSDNHHLYFNTYEFWVREEKTLDDIHLTGAQLRFSGDYSNSSFNITVANFYYSHIKDAETIWSSTTGYGNTISTKDPDGTANSGDEYTGYDSEFKLLEAGIDFTLKLDFAPIGLFFNMIDNQAVDTEGKANNFGVSLGATKKKGDWKVSYDYRKMERDSALGALVDADYAEGNTDSKGHKLRVDYMFKDNFKFSISHFDNETAVSSGKPVDFDKTMFDFFATF
ncbi:MAG: putative porin [Bdellovibrionales bacterium]|nr:putative porin [Bdellovibrionales bacterium]